MGTSLQSVHRGPERHAGAYVRAVEASAPENGGNLRIARSFPTEVERVAQGVGAPVTVMDPTA